MANNNKLLLFLNISFLFLLTFHLITSTVLHQSITPTTNLLNGVVETQGCTSLHDYSDYTTQCLYVKSHIGCKPKGYINYLQIFYCTYGEIPLLGYLLLLLWLLVLFYVLGNTAADFFCSSLESLSKLLNLPPTIAGTTLLSLGNGASDVFASIVSFTKSDDAEVGFNCVLGGAFFVSCVVVGVISLVTSSKEITVDKTSFFRDLIFFLTTLFSLFLIVFVGKISLLGSIAFVAIYFIYVCTVSATYFYQKNKQIETNTISNTNTNLFVVPYKPDLEEIGIPLLGYVDDEKPILESKINLDDQTVSFINPDSSFCQKSSKILKILEYPLYLPRRLTIPVVSEENWSKPYAVISVTLAPLLLATICNTQRENSSNSGTLVIYMVAGVISIVLGNIAFVTTKTTNPPRKCLLPWLAGGFFMSVTWTYITAEELVSLLVSIGHIIGISPSVLGLTVLAWGNSLGDLIANVAMAMNGGPDGVQIAISGCYAGPMFNTLVGLGLSLVFSSSSEYPSSYVIPKDPSLYETMGFLIGGLLWALVVLPRKNMKLDKLLGLGLLAIYCCFLFLRLAKVLGVLK